MIASCTSRLCAVCLRAIFLASCALFATSSIATPSTTTPQRIALLVGNWDYNLNSKYDASPSDGYTRDLLNPCHDTSLVKEQLAGFKIYDVCNLDKKSFDVEVEKFSAEIQRLPEKSLIFFYYSGHGLDWHGFSFAVPVLFKLDASLNSRAAEQKRRFFEQETNSITGLLKTFPITPNTPIVVVLDKCRNDPLDASSGYNGTASMLTPPNVLIHYATTAGDTTPDTSDFASVLAEEMAKSNDVGDIVSTVNSRITKSFLEGNRKTLSDADTGQYFVAMGRVPLRLNWSPPAPVTSINRPAVVRSIASVDAEQRTRSVEIARDTAAAPTGAEDVDSAVPPTPADRALALEASSDTAPESAAHDVAVSDVAGISATVVRRLKVVRNSYDGVTFDILWCEGKNDQERYAYALDFAKRLSERAPEFGIGRVAIKPLPEDKNANDGYGNVRRNILRFDHELPEERKILGSVAAAFPEAKFLPQRGVGVAGEPTLRYISAFVCGPVASPVE